MDYAKLICFSVCWVCLIWVWHLSLATLTVWFYKWLFSRYYELTLQQQSFESSFTPVTVGKVLSVFGGYPHLCCPDARDLLRQTLVGWWEVTPRSWTPPVYPGKTPVMRLEAVCLGDWLLVFLESVRRFLAQTSGVWLRWTAPATGTRWNLGCCTSRWVPGLCVQFLEREAELERSWDHWIFLMDISCYCLMRLSNQSNVMFTYVAPCP